MIYFWSTSIRELAPHHPWIFWLEDLLQCVSLGLLPVAILSLQGSSWMSPTICLMSWLGDAPVSTTLYLILLWSCSSNTSSLLPDIIADVVPHPGLCQPWESSGLQPSWRFSCCAGPHHHIRFLAAGQATLHGYSEHKNMILGLDMPIGSWIVSSHCLLCYYCSSLWYFLSYFLFFLLPHCTTA